MGFMVWLRAAVGGGASPVVSWRWGAAGWCTCRGIINGFASSPSWNCVGELPGSEVLSLMMRNHSGDFSAANRLACRGGSTPVEAHDSP